MIGIMEHDGLHVCGECHKVIDVQDSNFCSYCGNALTDTAMLLVYEREKSVKLSVLKSLVDDIDDKNTLEKILSKIMSLSD